MISLGPTLTAVCTTTSSSRAIWGYTPLDLAMMTASNVKGKASGTDLTSDVAMTSRAAAMLSGEVDALTRR